MNNIETLLKEKGLTKTAFSNLLGIKKQNLNGLLKNPTYETLKKISEALNVPMWQLFASPEDVKLESGRHVCPYCGGILNVKTEIEKWK